MVKQAEADFVAYVVDLLQGLGPVYSRRMFGGYGLFLDGLMFALITDRELYLKADDSSRDQFSALGLQPFTYYKQGRPTALSYFQAPEEALEDLELMTEWGNRAFAAALRAAAAKKPAREKRRRG